MKTTAPAILPIFRSRQQLQLLAELYLDGVPRSIGELHARTGIPQATLSRECDRLVEAGMLKESRSGRLRVVRAAEDSPYFEDLRGLLMKAVGPPAVLRKALEKITGIECALIFGSWARREADESGRIPRDIDLLVVGDLDASAVFDAIQEAEAILKLEIDPIVVSSSEWHKAKSGLLKEIKRGTKVWILGDRT